MTGPYSVQAILLFIPPVLVLVAFVLFLFRRRLWPWLFRLIEPWVVVVIPGLFLALSDSGERNNCCTDDVFFSPEHRPSMYTLLVLCALAYFLLSYRKRPAPPLVHVLLDLLLSIGIVINVIIVLHAEKPLGLIGNLPIILLFLMVLVEDHRRFIANTAEWMPRSQVEHVCWRLLRLPAMQKFPLLLVLCLPFLLLLTCGLMLFGQRPDALVRAFTDTYHHGLSQLDHECYDVVCGGHYLCTIAAKGHPAVVRPQRLGVRHGSVIICNRQLLVSNAFEDLLQECFPALHSWIRTNYDKVGRSVHRHYHLFDHKWVSDLIYVMMKPLEWAFILVLYLFDVSPEDRIARQYLHIEDRERILALKGGKT